MNKTYYIGLDVHKETIAIAHTFSGSRMKPFITGNAGAATSPWSTSCANSPTYSDNAPRLGMGASGARPNGLQRLPGSGCHDMTALHKLSGNIR